jgi:hypothetical protein
MKPLNLVLTCALFVAFGSNAQIGYAQVPNPTFEKLYANMKVAMGRRDKNAIAAILAPGFESEDASGRVQSAEQMIAELSSLPQDTNKKSKMTLLSVDISGNFAKVTQQYHMTTTKRLSSGESKSIELNTVLAMQL